MNARIIAVAVFLMGLVVLAACGGRSTPTPQALFGEAVEPCTFAPDSSVDPCAPGAVPESISVSPSSGPFLGDAPDDIAYYMGATGETEPDLTPHIVVRGTYLPGTERCTWPHSWRPAPYMDEADAEGALTIKCFADVKVHEYILGTGPSQLTVEVFFYPPLTAREAVINWLIEELEAMLVKAQSGVGGIMGREMVILLLPPLDYGVEAWFAGSYDVQRLEDGTVIVVHPGRDSWQYHQPEVYAKYRTSHFEIPLPTFKQAVLAAHETRVEKYGGRTGADEGLPMLVSDVHDLAGYMVRARAYEHPDGPPAQPPPVPGEGDSNPNGVSVDDGTAAPTPLGGS